MIAFTRGVPDHTAFPLEELSLCAQEAMTHDHDAILPYAGSRGFPLLREWVAETNGGSPDQILISHGALQILDFIATAYAPDGAAVLVEQPSYDRAVTVFRRAGCKVVGVPMEEDGINLEALVELGRRSNPALFYVIPDFQNPSGATLSLSKRQALAAWAVEHGCLLVEDIPYRRLRYQGVDLPTLRSFAPEQTIQLSSFSKLLSPGLRVGTAFGPLEQINRLAKVAEDTYITPSLLSQALVYRFLAHGWLDHQVQRLQELYGPRLEAMLGVLQEEMSDLADWVHPQGGFFVGLTLRSEIRADALLAKGKEVGLILSDGRGFYANGAGDRFVRLPFCALSPDEIRSGIQSLAEIVRGLAQGGTP